MTQKAFNAALQPQWLSLGEALEAAATIDEIFQTLTRFARRHFDSELSLQLLDLETNVPRGLTSKLNRLEKFHRLVEAEQRVMLNYDSENQSYLVCSPLISSNQTIGSLVLSREDKDYAASEITAIEDFSSMLANTLLTQQLEAKESYHQQQIDLIARVTSQIIQITDVDQLASEVTRLIQETFGYYYVAIFTLDPKKNELFFKAASSRSAKAAKMFTGENSQRTIQLGSHMIGTAAQTGKPILANDVRYAVHFKAEESLPETQSELSVPLKAGKTVLGVLDIESDQRHAFSRTDLNVMTALANNIAFAIQRLQLFQTLQKKNEELQAIAQVSRSINSTLDLDQLLQRVTDILHQEFNYPYVHIFLVNYVPNTIEFKAGSGQRSKAYRSQGIAYSIDCEEGIIPLTVRSGQTQILADVSQFQQFIPNPVTGSRQGSEICIPLKYGANILGVLDVQSDQPQAFRASDLELLNTLSSSISVALRNANLYKSETWRRRVAENLRDVALMLSENISLDEILHSILEKIMDLLPCDTACLWTLSSPDQADAEPMRKLSLAATRSAKGIKKLPKTFSFLVDDAWYTQALTRDAPVIYHPKMHPDPVAEKLGISNKYSSIAAPLTTTGRQLGILTLHHHTANRYGDETRSICASFAGYAGIALENANLLQQAREQAWISTILLQVALATQSVNKLEELSKTIMRLILMFLDGNSGGLLIPEYDGASYKFYAAFTKQKRADDLETKVFNIPASSALQASMRLEDITALPGHRLDKNLAEILELKRNATCILLPLIAHDDKLGLLIHTSSKAFKNKKPETVLSQQRYAVMQGIKQQTAVSIQNIRFLEEREEEAYSSAVLLQTSQMLYTRQTLSEALEGICQTLVTVTGLSAAMILRWSGDGNQLELCQIASRQLSRLQETGLIGRKINLSQLSNIKKNSSTKSHTRISAKLLPELHFFSPNQSSETEFLFFPLKVHNDDYGLMVVEPSQNHKAERQNALLESVAQQVSFSIQNDQLKTARHQQDLTEREFQMARQIQKTFLPETLPPLDGYDLDAIWQTARQVGGDFYDVFMLDSHKAGLVIADVSDKGFPAALYMTVTRTLLRAIAFESPSPARTLEKVNKMLQVNSQGGFFVTVFYAIVDLKTGKVSYTCAGHNPPVLLSQNRAAQQLPRGGIALGILDEVFLQDQELLLQQGDTLVLYTDGITEAINRDQALYGLERFLKVLEANRKLSSAQLIQATLADLELFREGEVFSDDITQLVIKRL